MSPRTQLAVAAAGVTMLSATALHAVFLDTGWVAPVVGAVLAVLVGAELGSRLGQHLVARAIWRLVGSLLGTLFYITAVFAHQGAILGFIPRGRTWHLLRILTDRSFSEVHDLATPAPTYKALMLLTAVGLAGVAIAVDQLSVRAPLIGLPLLALYSVPEWLSPHGTGWVPLALGGSGYVGLLIREGRDRTGRWGRTVTGASSLGRSRSAAATMSQAGWRIGAVALAVALVVPPLIPDLGHFNLSKGGGTSTSTTIHYNLFTQLGGSLNQGTVTPQYEYTASDGEGHYLRMATDDVYDKGGDEWDPSTLVPDPGVDPTTDNLQPSGVSANAGATTLQTIVRIGHQLGSPDLPVPISTTKLDGLQGQWSYQQTSETIFSASAEETKNQSFTATSDVISPSSAALEASTLTAEDLADYQADTEVPADLPRAVYDKAVAVTKGATTEYERAVALQDWFYSTGKFKYSLIGPTGSGYQPLLAFISTDRQGFCQQFASAMAIMARSLGIPARVALGFTPGTQTDGTGAYHVDSHDYHAWPELYFDGIGWLRFEPTPRTDGQTQLPSYGNTTLAEIHAANKVAAATPEDPLTKQPRQVSPTTPAAAKGHAPQGSGASSSDWSVPISGRTLGVVLVAGGLVLLIIALPLLQSAGRRRRLRDGDDPRGVALVAWRETLRDAADLGFSTSVADSPRQAARRLTDAAALSHSAEQALDRLARAVERARYAPLAGDAAGLLADVGTVTTAMYGSASRRSRLRARTLPPSTTRGAADLLARTTAAISQWAGRGSDRVNRALGRRPSSA